MSVIETLEALETAVKEIFEHKEAIIGMDCEFRSSYIPGEDCKADLLQIASASKIYLVDLIKLSDENSFKLIGELMSSYDILKIGIGFKEDLKGVIRRFQEEEMVC